MISVNSVLKRNHNNKNRYGNGLNNERLLHTTEAFASILARFWPSEVDKRKQLCTIIIWAVVYLKYYNLGKCLQVIPCIEKHLSDTYTTLFLYTQRNSPNNHIYKHIPFNKLIYTIISWYYI